MRMITRQLMILAAGLALCLGAAGCGPHQSSAFPLSVETVRQLSPTNTAQISFQEHGGEILVTVVDKSGDSHIHRLNYEGISRQQALELLKQKQAELETRR